MAAVFGAGDPVAAAVVVLAKHGWSDRQVNLVAKGGRLDRQKRN
jgi:hypothetical protein